MLKLIDNPTAANAVTDGGAARAAAAALPCDVLDNLGARFRRPGGQSVGEFLRPPPQDARRVRRSSRRAGISGSSGYFPCGMSAG